MREYDCDGLEDTAEMAMRVLHVPTKPEEATLLPNKKEGFLVGVYGTLKKDFSNFQYYLKDAKYLGDASVPGLMISLGNFPMLLIQPEEFAFRPGNKISVQVFQVDKRTIERLDKLEGHPRFYERRSTGTLEFGLVDVYYGHAKNYYIGKQKVIWNGKWHGTASTPYLEVDFNDGSKKPKILAKANMHIDKRTGEVTFGDTAENIEVLDIVPPTPSISNIPKADQAGIEAYFDRLEGARQRGRDARDLSPKDVRIDTKEELLGIYPNIKSI